MKDLSTQVWDDHHKRLVALSRALAEFRDSLALLSLALEDYQFERDLSSRRDVEYATNRLLEGLMIKAGADRPDGPDAPLS
jgi:hypothetical protein